MEAGAIRHVPAALPPGKGPGFHCTGDGWPHELNGRGAENLTHTGIRLPDRPAPSQWLYRLRYPGPMKLLLFW
jgi:hypothetical protein